MDNFVIPFDFNSYTTVNITLNHWGDLVMSKSQTDCLDWQKIKYYISSVEELFSPEICDLWVMSCCICGHICPPGSSVNDIVCSSIKKGLVIPFF